MYSTSKGKVSIRNEIQGSWFIQDLCGQLEKMKSQDLISVLTKVNYSVAQRIGEIEFDNGEIIMAKQIPIIVSSLRKKIYFHVNKEARGEECNEKNGKNKKCIKRGEKRNWWTKCFC